MTEEDIRPKLIFDEYLRLTKIDTKVFFGNNVLRESIPCPACGSIGELSFTKEDFDYELCPDCDTLFVSPRPINEAFNSYYSNAPSTEYWATVFYKATSKVRRDKIWKTKAKSIHQTVKRFGNENYEVVDIGGGYGIFAEVMHSLFGKKTTVIEPGFHLANSCREKGINVIEKFLEGVKRSDLPQGCKIFVSFELFEHLHSPRIFLKQLFGLMQSGDLFVFTTLSGMGFDIQALWEDSKSVSPPHHLNFFNPYSVKILIEEIGFKVLEISTPGKLDIDILSNNRNLIKDRFLKTFVKYASDSGWSSHMMIVCQKP